MAPKEQLKELRIQIKKGKYDWKEAIEDTVNRIIDYPQALLWDWGYQK